MKKLTEKKSIWNKICINFVNLNIFNMKKLMYSIFGEPTPRDRGIRGTDAGKLYIDKKVFFKRDDVKRVISDIYSSKIIKKQIAESNL